MDKKSSGALEKGVTAGFGFLLVLIVLPWVIDAEIPMEYKKYFTALLYKYITPLFLFLTGLHTGECLKKLWYLPIVSGILFLVMKIILFPPFKTSDLLYMLGYVVVSFGGMLLGWGIGLLREKEKNRKKRK